MYPLLIPTFISSLLAQSSLRMPPPTPLAIPSDNQDLQIPEIFLKDPLVQNALKYVESVVSPALLAITKSIPKFAQVTYTSNAAANCYWPANNCLVDQDTKDFKADITSCLGNGVWGISYDDGPIVDPAGKSGTKELLSSLKQTNLTSTFFVIGARASVNPEILTQAAKDGHEIAVHTWTHHPLTTLTNEQIVAEIKYTEHIIYKATGKIPRLFRPPYGDCDNRVRAIVSALGYRTVYWENDSKDADLPETATPQQITTNANNVLSWFNSATNSFITLEHDTSYQSVASALQVLEGVRRLGDGFVMKGRSVAGCNKVEWFLSSNLTTTPTSATATPTVVSSKGNGGNGLFVGGFGLISVVLLAFF